MGDRFKLRRGTRDKIDLKVFELGYLNSEKRLCIQDDTVIEFPNKEDLKTVEDKIKDSSSVFIGETLPDISERTNGLYMRKTEVLSSFGNNVKISPNMGLKEVTE